MRGKHHDQNQPISFTVFIFCIGALGRPNEAAEDTTSAQEKDGNATTNQPMQDK